MKKILAEIIKKYLSLIVKDWTEKLYNQQHQKFSKAQLKTVVRNSLHTILEILDSEDYIKADEYLIDIYNFFSRQNLTLLDVSQIFSQARYVVLTYLEKDKSYSQDPVILLGFLDEIIEQIFARYSMIHQEARMKELETDRDRLATKLELNQQYLKNLLHSSDSAIFVIDESEEIISWNIGAENMFGYTENEAIGQISSFLLPPEKKFTVELEKIQNQVFKEGHIKISETERITKSKERIPVQVVVTGLPNREGIYKARTVIINDVTEVKALQRQVDQSEKLAVIGQLAAGVAHEIGNPLASISSLVQILQRKTTDEFSVLQLANIKENIDRISKIVRELVDFSRPTGQEEIDTEICEVIRTALGIVKYDKRVKKVDFIADLKKDLPRVNIVPDQLLQVFVNILINALDAINGNGTIEVKSYKAGSYVLIEIIDNGTGMSENTMEKIFDPFFTTKDVGKGTGLGLSVSYGIINKFKGDISVESKLGEYSKFIIKLPIDSN